MATIEAGIAIKTSDDYLAEIYELIGEEFPIEITVVNGKIQNIVAETEWKAGSVSYDAETDEYVETADIKTLTQTQIAKLNQYIAENVETE